MVLGVFMKKIFVFFVLLGLLASCSTSESKYLVISGLSYTDGMEDNSWRLSVVFDSISYDDKVFEGNIDVLAVEARRNFIAKINLNQHDYRFLLSIMMNEKESVRFWLESSERSIEGVRVSFLRNEIAENAISSLNQS
jgi:hypothetical protein